MLAVRELATSVILVHNHPSDRTNPSDSDKETTKKIKKALSYVDIKVLDHLIISPNEYFSLAENGLI